jgi:transcriptional regulator with XRE-family HTH domain
MQIASRPSRQKSWHTATKRVSVLAALAIRKQTVSRVLGELRQAHGDPDTGKPLPQEEAARRVGVSYRQWQRWEAGDSVPYPRSLEAIAQAFDIDVSQFFDEPTARPATPDPFAGADLKRQLDRIENMLRAQLRMLRDAGVIEPPGELDALGLPDDLAQWLRAGPPAPHTTEPDERPEEEEPPAAAG